LVVTVEILDPTVAWPQLTLWWWTMWRWMLCH
jgi:hypothetical protein